LSSHPVPSERRICAAGPIFASSPTATLPRRWPLIAESESPVLPPGDSQPWFDPGRLGRVTPAAAAGPPDAEHRSRKRLALRFPPPLFRLIWKSWKRRFSPPTPTVGAGAKKSGCSADNFPSFSSVAGRSIAPHPGPAPKPYRYCTIMFIPGWLQGETLVVSVSAFQVALDSITAETASWIAFH